MEKEAEFVLVNNSVDSDDWMKTLPGYRSERKIIQERLLNEESLKGGPGSGNYGHAGRPGKWGGSLPTKSGREGAAMSLGTGRTAEARQRGASTHSKYRIRMVQNSIDQFANEIKPLEYERTAIFDENGVIFFEKAGNRNTIDFNDAEIKKMMGCRAMVHNHPGVNIKSDGIDRGFSAADLFFACGTQTKEMVVQAGNSRFTIKPKPGENFPYVDRFTSDNRVWKTIEAMDSQVLSANYKQINAGEIDVKRAEWEHSRELALAFANYYGLIYQETKTG